MQRSKQTLDEFTWPEVYEKISRTETVFFPTGPQECHGKYLPMGTDMYVAHAVGLLAAAEREAVVLHPLAYSFTGATSGFRGSVSIPMTLHTEILKAVIRDLWRQNFRSIMVLSIHAPNDFTMLTTIRELFEYEEIVASYFNPYKYIDEKEYDYDSVQKEAVMCYASMEVLGLHDFIPENPETIPYEKSRPWKPEERVPYAGYYFMDVTQHQPGRPVSLEIGRKMLKDAAIELNRQAEELQKYTRFIKNGGNPPFSVNI